MDEPYNDSKLRDQIKGDKMKKLMLVVLSALFVASMVLAGATKSESAIVILNLQ
jgi:hypothetical protein